MEGKDFLAAVFCVMLFVGLAVLIEPERAGQWFARLSNGFKQESTL